MSVTIIVQYFELLILSEESQVIRLLKQLQRHSLLVVILGISATHGHGGYHHLSLNSQNCLMDLSEDGRVVELFVISEDLLHPSSFRAKFLSLVALAIGLIRK